MKKVFFIALMLSFLLPVGMISRAEEYDAQHTLLALNYAIMSIYRVEKIPSKVTVDEEYNGIINNLAIGNITDDQELIDLFTSMMDAYTEDKLEAKDRELIRRQYEAQVNSAFLKVKPLKHIQTEVAISTAKEVVNAAQNAQSFASGILAMGGAAASGLGEYTLALQANERMRMQAQSEEQEYMQQRMAGEWALTKEKIRRFNGLKKNLLNAEWRLLRKYNLPDEARLTEETISQFYSFISDKDIAKALRTAKRLESNFNYYPPFWFYYGKAALENGNNGLARTCFDKFFEQSRPILRKDQFAASTARYKIFTLRNTEQDEAKNLLGVIEKNSAQDDWNNFLFCALQWYALGDKHKADDLLLRNIDFNYDVALHTEIRRQLAEGKIDLAGIKAVAIKEFSDPTELEKLAESGNADAQFRLGEMLYRKGSTKEAAKEAIIWLEKAAQQNNFLAKARIFGIECKENKQSETLSNPYLSTLEERASQNDMDSIILLADCYQSGYGVQRDYKKALSYFKKAEKSDIGYTNLSMAEIYRVGGLDVDKDEQKAFEYYQKGADSGYAYAQNRLGVFYQRGIGTQKDDQKAVYWYTKAAEQGFPVAQFNLAFCYKEGIGVQKDEQRAVYWYTKSAERGDAKAQFLLAVCYYNGLGVTKDYNKTVHWLTKSSEQGYASAQRMLGNCYYNGHGVLKDEQKAVYLYTKAAEQGDSIAQTTLGMCYINGIGVPKDASKSAYWTTKAADQGNNQAQLNLAMLYQYGVGVSKDIDKAIFWYKKSASQGNQEAQQALRKLGR